MNGRERTPLDIVQRNTIPSGQNGASLSKLEQATLVIREITGHHANAKKSGSLKVEFHYDQQGNLSRVTFIEANTL